jgi:transcriptional regulator with XRE-family HTH domain
MGQRKQNLKNEIITHVEEIILAKGISHAELARRIGISAQSLGAFFDKRTDALPSVNTLFKIARALNSKIHISIE